MAELAFALLSFGVALAGGAAGLVLGNLRLPAAIALASGPAAGAGANLFISAASATAGTVSHVRGRRVDWRVAGLMAPPTAIAAFGAGLVAGYLPEDLLLIVIAAVLIVSGLDVLRQARADAPSDRPERGGPLAVIAVAAIVGALGGLVGLMLGSLRMPAMIRTLRMPAARAVGTNMLLGAVLGIAGLVGYVFGGGIDWRLAAIGTLASVPGALLGAGLTGRLSQPATLRLVAAAVVVSAVAILVQVVVG